jgi:hypothetical protein
VVADVIGLPPLSPHIGDRRYFDGEEKRLSKLEEDGLSLELLQPLRANALPTEYSEIEIRHRDRRVFCIRWDGANHFKVIVYEAGDWEQTLLGWWEPIPFD